MPTDPRAHERIDEMVQRIGKAEATLAEHKVRHEESAKTQTRLLNVAEKLDARMDQIHEAQASSATALAGALSSIQTTLSQMASQKPSNNGATIRKKDTDKLTLEFSKAKLWAIGLIIGGALVGAGVAIYELLTE